MSPKLLLKAFPAVLLMVVQVVGMGGVGLGGGGAIAVSSTVASQPE